MRGDGREGKSDFGSDSNSGSRARGGGSRKGKGADVECVLSLNGRGE
jgi:hypothetical protein